MPFRSKPLPPLFRLSRRRSPPSFPLFPYTTLFRSLAPPRCSCPGWLRIEPFEGRWQAHWSPYAFAGSVPTRDLARDSVPLRSEEHTSELQSRQYLICRLLLEK